MSRVFVIPDVHLKPWIFDKVEEELSKREYDRIVLLGDLVDDWGQEENLNLYRKTFVAAKRFMEKHPDLLFCYGNHDISYVWEAHETGYSDAARDIVLEGLSSLKDVLPDDSFAFIHKIDDALFSHAGLTEAFVSHFFPDHKDGIDDLVRRVNGFGKEELWNDASPIWTRPQNGRIEMYSEVMLQVVGHTPVRKPDYFKGVLSLDTFSTYRDGDPIGDQRFVWVDTITGQWGYTDNDMVPEELPDPKLDIRTYHEGDRVRFKVKFAETGETETVEGTVEIIDRYPGGYSSIDVFSDDTLYKHIPLRDVVEHYGAEE